MIKFIFLLFESLLMGVIKIKIDAYVHNSVALFAITAAIQYVESLKVAVFPQGKSLYVTCRFNT